MDADLSVKRAPTIFFSHGAGPFPLMGVDHQQPLVDLSKKSRWMLDGVKGVIIVTAHWETDHPYISSGPNPELFFDYYEFASQLPPEAFAFKYPAPGDPELARRLKEKFEAEGLGATLDDTRGWDHGIWVPMIMLRPQADLPIVQLSIPDGRESANEASLKLGRALESFRDEGYAILASGSSWHDFDAQINQVMGKSDSSDIRSNRPFEDTMEEVAAIPDAKKKYERMLNWRKDFPDNVAVHPIGKGEHFLPFLVACGCAGDDVGKKVGEWEMMGAIMSSYIW